MTGYKNKAVVNGAIIAVNVVYFLFLETAGSTLSTRFMIRMGAMYAPLIFEEGEYYRLFTSMFMHFGSRHLFNNMLVLFLLGDNLERALGHVKYLFFYLLCGLGGNLFSLVMGNAAGIDYQTVSAGASGAIFGVVGGLIYAVAVNRGRLEDLSTRQLMFLTVVTLYHGFINTGINNAAHIGGLLTGLVLGLLLYRKPKGGDYYDERGLHFL